MGWWSTASVTGQALHLGDEPYDEMMACLQRVGDSYAKRFGRKPILAELVRTFETVLAVGAADYAADGQDVEVVALPLKSRRRPRSQKWQEGDFFTIPVGELRAIGRVLSTADVKDKGPLLGVYDGTHLRIPHVSTVVSSPWAVSPFHSDGEALDTWRWRVFGNMPVSADDFSPPRFKEGLDSVGWWIREGESLTEATSEQVKDLQYATIWSTSGAERMISKALSAGRL
jgi:hypothetical protein